MRELLFLAALFVTGIALPIEERINGENGWFVPQEDGTFEWMDKKDAEELLENISPLEFRSNEVSFYLYTKQNPTEGKKLVPMSLQL
ncbi:GM10145 [Drosophila sechellia]|uniref:GM10145 n=1 Tax=Drosophila sechellia TaxID=7238 RepID=B4IC23_DROSE|nr:GM10145 [Drosophila sechellia]